MDMRTRPVNQESGNIAAASPRPDASTHSHTVRLLHTSDVHVGDGRRSSADGDWPESGLACLSRMTQLAREQRVDAILIAGDLFDHNRVDAPTVAMAARILEEARVAVMILPGNHDPYMAGGVYLRCADLFPSNVQVISSGSGEVLPIEPAGIQVWGRAHTDFHDWSPTEGVPRWFHDPVRPLWRIAMAHGLYVRSEYESRLSYRIHASELDGLQAHYVALGHLELHEPVGDGRSLAYYPGALDRSGGATIVTLDPQAVRVGHVRFPEPAVAG